MPRHAPTIPRWGRFEAVPRCGCVFRLHAKWTEPPTRWPDGTRVQVLQPIPGTIRTVETLSVCPEHRTLQFTPLPLDPYAHYDAVHGGYLGRWVPCDLHPDQRPHRRLQIPDTLSAAARLYVHHFRWTRTIVKPDTCGCAITLLFDRAEVQQAHAAQRHAAYTILDHPTQSLRCRHHQDVDGWRRALAENAQKNDALHAIKRVVPRLVYTAAEARAINVTTYLGAGGIAAQLASLSDGDLVAALRTHRLPMVNADDFRPAVTPIWAFDAARQLSITLHGTTLEEQQAIAQAIAAVSPTIRLRAA